MEIKDLMHLKHLCISNLILIILNNNNDDFVRKCAEVELKKRIRNFGCEYNDFLHIEDAVIKERGLDINNYLISPKVNMQQLIETYFLYSKDTDEDTNRLLFSEKHLCNELDFGEPFFGKICVREIKNIDERLNNVEFESQKQLLLSIKSMLEYRQQKAKQAIIDEKKDRLVHIQYISDTMCQLNSIELMGFLEFLYNISLEERYKLMSSKLGFIKMIFLEILNDSIFDSDSMQNLYGLHFAIKDSLKLNRQKKQLLQQVRNGYKVDYESDTMQYALQKVKNRNN